MNGREASEGHWLNWIVGGGSEISLIYFTLIALMPMMVNAIDGRWSRWNLFNSMEFHAFTVQKNNETNCNKEKYL